MSSDGEVSDEERPPKAARMSSLAPRTSLEALEELCCWVDVNLIVATMIIFVIIIIFLLLYLLLSFSSISRLLLATLNFWYLTSSLWYFKLESKRLHQLW